SAQKAHRRERKGQDEKANGDEQGGRIAGLLKLEGDLVSIKRNEFRRRSRTALGQDENLVERPESIDCPQHNGDGENRSHHRQGEINKSPPRASAVNLCGFERLLWQRLQAREENEENERRPLPHIEHDEADESLYGIAEDLDLSTPQRERQGGQHAGLVGIHEPEYDCDDDRRNHHRHDEDRSQEPDPRKFLRANNASAKPRTV